MASNWRRAAARRSTAATPLSLARCAASFACSKPDRQSSHRLFVLVRAGGLGGVRRRPEARFQPPARPRPNPRRRTLWRNAQRRGFNRQPAFWPVSSCREAAWAGWRLWAWGRALAAVFGFPVWPLPTPVAAATPRLPPPSARAYG